MATWREAVDMLDRFHDAESIRSMRMENDLFVARLQNRGEPPPSMVSYHAENGVLVMLWPTDESGSGRSVRFTYAGPRALGWDLGSE